MELDLDVLADVYLFQNILAQDYAQLLQCIGAYRRHYSKSEYILFSGNQMKEIGLVLQGTVQIIKEDYWGTKFILSLIHSTDIFGESLVCGGLNSSIVSFQATEECEILFLPFKRVLSICGRSCKFHFQLVENMVAVLAQKNLLLMEKLEIVSKKTIRERILAYLSQQSLRSNTPYFECPMGRTDLADYLCVDRSALTRELSRMKTEGLIDYDKNTFILPAEYSRK